MDGLHTRANTRYNVHTEAKGLLENIHIFIGFKKYSTMPRVFLLLHVIIVVVFSSHNNILYKVTAPVAR